MIQANTKTQTDTITTENTIALTSTIAQEYNITLAETTNLGVG